MQYWKISLSFTTNNGHQSCYRAININTTYSDLQVMQMQCKCPLVPCRVWFFGWVYCSVCKYLKKDDYEFFLCKFAKLCKRKGLNHFLSICKHCLYYFDRQKKIFLTFLPSIFLSNPKFLEIHLYNSYFTI